MEIYFPIKDRDASFNRYYCLMDVEGKPMTSNYKGNLGLILLASDVAQKIKNKDLENYLIVDMSLGIFEENSILNRLNPLNSLEYEIFNFLVRTNLKKGRKSKR